MSKSQQSITAARGPEAVRRRLLDAAGELLSGAPPTEVSTKRIAQVAGVNHGQIHHYFGSKDALVAATVADSAARYQQQQLREGHYFPLPIDIERSPSWRTLAYLASTGRWRQPPFEPSPVVAALAERRAEDLGVETSAPEVMADVAAAIALQRGWWIFRDFIETALAPFGAEPAAVRREVAERSGRLIDESIPLADVSRTVPEIDPSLGVDVGAKPHGPDEVRRSLVRAARQLLADRSPTEVTTKQIATAAGVNHGQVHHYFESKEHLIAQTIQVGSAAIVAAIDTGALPTPVPIQTDLHRPLAKTLAHIASTEAWADVAYERSPVVARMVEVVADRLGAPTSSTTVHAQVAVVHALDLGWAIYRDIIEYGLDQYGGDLAAMRRRLAAISGRLVDDPVRRPTT